MSRQESGGSTGGGPTRELPASLKAAAALAGPTKPLLRPVWRSALPVALGAATAIVGIVALGQRPDAAALGTYLHLWSAYRTGHPDAPEDMVFTP